MIKWLISYQWIFYQLLGLTTILANNVLARKYGLCWGTYLFSVTMAIAVNAWCFVLSYATAPSFFQVWFVSIALLTLYGFAGSLIFFGETITVMKLIGVTSVLLGAFLLIR